MNIAGILYLAVKNASRDLCESIICRALMVINIAVCNATFKLETLS